jgi:hypothetical protein
MVNTYSTRYDAVIKINFLETKSNTHWPPKRKSLQHHVCFIHNAIKYTPCQYTHKKKVTLVCALMCVLSVIILNKFVRKGTWCGTIREFTDACYFDFYLTTGLYLSLWHATTQYKTIWTKNSQLLATDTTRSLQCIMM